MATHLFVCSTLAFLPLIAPAAELAQHRAAMTYAVERSMSSTCGWSEVRPTEWHFDMSLENPFEGVPWTWTHGPDGDELVPVTGTGDVPHHETGEYVSAWPDLPVSDLGPDPENVRFVERSPVVPAWLANVHTQILDGADWRRPRGP